MSVGFNSFRISQKLPALVVGCAILVGMGVGSAAYLVASMTVTEQAQTKLTAIADAGKREIQHFLDAMQRDVLATASTATTIDALKNFNRTWLDWSQISAPGPDLRQTFVDNNPYAAGDRHLMDAPATQNLTNINSLHYNMHHQRYHPGYRAQMQQQGYEDILLLDVSGNVTYSLTKGADFATSVMENGGAAANGLGAVFSAASELPAGEIAFSDFAAYAPIGGAPASFVAAPVFNETGERLGVFAVRVPIQRLNSYLHDRSGLGETGEVYLVGADGLVRSDLLHTPENDLLTVEHLGPVIQRSIEGQPSSGEDISVIGVPSFVSAEPLTFGKVNFAVVAEQSRAELLAPIAQMRDLILMIGGGLILGAALIGILFSRAISRPIGNLTQTMLRLAEGDLDVEIASVGRKDELGEMGRAVEVFRANGLRIASMTEEQKAASIQRAEDRARMMQALQLSFGEVVDAAIAGDFGKRVDVSFEDVALNGLATSINALVETVDRGLGETRDVLGAIALADLTQRVEGDYQGAFLDLKDAANAVADKLTEILRHLKDTSASVRAATGEILSGANDLADRTSRQAAMIEETSAVMNQLPGTATEAAQRAESAVGQAQVASSTAEQGGQVMHSATQAMERISASSSKISNIIGLIDDIAFQTNLLALNASVEAARAGEAGKGFAVVAVEVRRLAQSAAEASQEIKQLIERSTNEVKVGTNLVAEAAEKLVATLKAVQTSEQFMHGIATSSKEQTCSIEDVTAAVQQMEEMTQHNAALVEETNAAIEQTDGQAQELDRIVDTFQLPPEMALQGSDQIAEPTSSPQDDILRFPASDLRPRDLRVVQSA